MRMGLGDGREEVEDVKGGGEGRGCCEKGNEPTMYFFLFIFFTFSLFVGIKADVICYVYVARPESEKLKKQNY